MTLQLLFEYGLVVIVFIVIAGAVAVMCGLFDK